MMKKVLLPLQAFFALAIVLWSPRLTLAQEPSPYESRFFEAAKVYIQKDYALYDALEFSLFDMSEIKLSDETNSSTDTEAAPTTLLEDTKTHLKELPKFFYRHLKKHLMTQKVPVTLYPSEPPSYTKPLQLSLKIKTIRFKTVPAEKGEPLTALELRIFGQITDKKTGEIFFKFYDTTSETLALSGISLFDNLDQLSGKIMEHLALFLKTQY